MTTSAGTGTDRKKLLIPPKAWKRKTCCFLGNVPQEAPKTFADAVLEVDKY